MCCPDAYAKGDSYRRQLEATRAFVQEHNLDLDDSLSLEDLGLSAYKGDHLGENGALGKFIEAINNGLVPRGSYLIIESLDRLSRQKVTAALELFLAILRKGIVIVTLTDKQIYSSESIDENYTQLIVSLSIMSRSHEESKIKGQRVHEAFNAKKQLARESKKKVSKNGPLWCDWDEKKQDFVLNPDKATIVRRIYDLALRDYGAWDITRILNEEEVPRMSRSTHTTWDHSIIHHLLTTKTVLGWYQPTIRSSGKKLPDGDPIPDYYPKVVDEDTFNRVQAKLASRKRGGVGAGRKGKHFANLFRGIFECGYCGHTFTRSEFKYPGTDKPKRAYLMCNGKTRRGCCDAPNVRYEPIEDQILKTMRELDFDQIFDSSSSESQRTKIQQSLEIKRSEQSENKKKLDRGLELMFENEDIPSSVLQKIKDFEKFDAKVSKEIEILETQLHSTDQICVSNSDVKKELEAAIKSMSECTNEAELRDMRQNVNSQMKTLLDRIVIWNGGQVASEQYFKHTEEKMRKLGTWKDGFFSKDKVAALRTMMGSEYNKHLVQANLHFNSGKKRTIWIDLKNCTSQVAELDPSAQKVRIDDPRIQAIIARQQKSIAKYEA